MHQPTNETLLSLRMPIWLMGILDIEGDKNNMSKSQTAKLILYEGLAEKNIITPDQLTALLGFMKNDLINNWVERKAVKFLKENSFEKSVYDDIIAAIPKKSENAK